MVTLREIYGGGRRGGVSEFFKLCCCLSRYESCLCLCWYRRSVCEFFEVREGRREGSVLG